MKKRERNREAFAAVVPQYLGQKAEVINAPPYGSPINPGYLAKQVAVDGRPVEMGLRDPAQLE
jgi:hypothetical protein